MIGGSSSTTVTVKEHSAVFPAASIAVQVTVVSPTGKKLPDEGEHDTVTGGNPPVTIGSGKFTIAPH